MEDISDYREQIRIAKMARTALIEFNNKHPEMYKKFVKWFHLRAGSSNVTVVTTHLDRPMRGIHIGKTKIGNTIEFLAKCIGDDSKTIDWDRIKKEYKERKEFKTGFQNREFPYQAKMINGLSRNHELKKLLNVHDLYFTASEVIFSRGTNERKKVDIIAHDGAGKVFFFEMKAPENKLDDPVRQVKKYIKVYGKKGTVKNEIFEEMMANYPQNPITNIKEYIGYGVIGYCENPVLKGKMLIECR